MIFFFDYLYMQCCDYYKKYKSEQALEEWKISALFIVAGATALIVGVMNILMYHYIIKPKIECEQELVDDFFLYSKIGTIVIFIVLFILFWIRYKKYTNYEEILDKVRQLSRTKKTMFHLLILLYLLASLPLFIFVAWYFSP